MHAMHIDRDLELLFLILKLYGGSIEAVDRIDQSLAVSLSGLLLIFY